VVDIEYSGISTGNRAPAMDRADAAFPGMEAAIEPDPVPTGEVTKETQIIAIYGKGGIGKSFALANLSAT
jgi:hypothetical protein